MPTSPSTTANIPSRPKISINGQTDIIDQNIIFVRYRENSAQSNLLEVSLTNWGITNNQPGYLYSDGNLLYLSAIIGLYIDQIFLAEGPITGLAPDFPANGPPTISFTVDAKRPVQNKSQQVPQEPLTLTWGQNLREFHPVLQKTANLSLSVINATGISDFLPTLTVGTKLNLQNLGSKWNGEYSVSETTLTFDLQHGHRIGFVAQRYMVGHVIRQPLNG